MVFSEPGRSPFQVNKGGYTKVESVFPLPEGHKLYYLFDFGYNWVFEITCHPEIRQHSGRLHEPKVIQESGERPEQYPDLDWCLGPPPDEDGESS